ncbi:LysR family transcriptional regulator [Saccharibacillus sp. CPCC 101409]|uniref:LysR family transcriptional regulator n=1 Tax=Saccharibacillus sp. CPCC 101409 TaxID=3058041 RepID=UPI002673E686|nr:LysR family transcriptional regulator [Saccharibacillus sp. CPCC 101409]MDO3413102.1 LysR family transcriptional regulator [Saccharibacillus sp. CPCC 101409]
MDLRQLRYFAAVAREGQITAAAKKLNMEQPPLSRQMKQLEEEMGTALFDRSGRRLALTEAGQRLYERSEELFVRFEETMLEIRELGEGSGGTLSIGAVVSCVSLLPGAIERFSRGYPGVGFKIQGGDHFQLAELLRRRRIELILARLPFEAPHGADDYIVAPLPNDPLAVAVPASWTEYAGRDSIGLGELADRPFLTLKTDLTTGMHERIMLEFGERGVQPDVFCECSSVSVILALIAQGLGVSLLPRSVLDSLRPEGCRMLELENAELQPDVGVIWLRGRYLSKSAERFIAELRHRPGGSA